MARRSRSSAPGASAIALLGLGEEVLEINITPDRGYCFSMRGIAREYSHSTGARFTDPADGANADLYPRGVAEAGEGGFDVVVPEDPRPIHGRPGCDRYVARVVRGVDPAAPSPAWMRERLTVAGMRPISLAVDVTNYVMLDLGQPLHAFDLAKLHGPIVVRRARAGETLAFLDGVTREIIDMAKKDLVYTKIKPPTNKKRDKKNFYHKKCKSNIQDSF